MKAENRMRILGLMFLVILVLSAYSVNAAIKVPYTKEVKTFFTADKMLMNAFVIAGILFVLQIFVFSSYFKDSYSKSDSQKIVLYIALIAISVVAAYNFGIQNPGKGIWEWDLVYKLLYKEVLINAAITGVVVFFVCAVLLKNYIDMSKSETKAAVILAIIVIAFVAAVRPLEGMDKSATDKFIKEGKYKYIWQEEWFMKGRLYLFGDENCYGSIEWRQVEQMKQDAKDYNPDTMSWYDKPFDWYRQAKSLVDKRTIHSGNAGSYAEQLKIYEEAKTNAETAKTAGDKENQATAEELLRKTKEGMNIGKEEQFCYTKESYLQQKDRTLKGDYKADADKEPKIEGWGILRGSHLYMFIVGILMYYMIFRYWGGNKEFGTMLWIVTIWLSADTAHSGMSQTWFWQFAYYVLLITTYMMFKETSSPGFAAAFSYGLINTLANTTFWQYGIGWGALFGPGNNFMANFWTGFLVGKMILEGLEGDANSKILGWKKSELENYANSLTKYGLGGAVLAGLGGLPALVLGGIGYGALKLGSYLYSKFKKGASEIKKLQGEVDRLAAELETLETTTLDQIENELVNAKSELAIKENVLSRLSNEDKEKYERAKQTVNVQANAASGANVETAINSSGLTSTDDMRAALAAAYNMFLAEKKRKDMIRRVTTISQDIRKKNKIMSNIVDTLKIESQEKLKSWEDNIPDDLKPHVQRAIAMKQYHEAERQINPEGRSS